MKDINPQDHAAQWTISRKKKKKEITCRPITIELLKTVRADKIFKACRRNTLKLKTDFSKETTQARRQCHDIFKVLKIIYKHNINSTPKEKTFQQCG